MVERDGGDNGGGISRRAFLHMLSVAVGVTAVAPGLVGCEPPAKPNLLSNLDKEQLQQLRDRIWGGLTEVLNEDRFSRESLQVSAVTVDGHETSIQGTLAGTSKQAGVNFAVNFADLPDAEGNRLQLDTASGAVVLGERVKQAIELNYFLGETAGDVRKKQPFLLSVAENPEEMKQRFEDITEVLKTHLRISANTPFIPAEDFNGLLTYTSNRTGYGQLIESVGGINEKAVRINVRDGLVTQYGIWEGVRVKGPDGSLSDYHVRPAGISFKELLRYTLMRVNNQGYENHWEREYKLNPIPAKDYINQLGDQYIPNQFSASK